MRAGAFNAQHCHQGDSGKDGSIKHESHLLGDQRRPNFCVPFEGLCPVSEARLVGFPHIGLFEFSLIVIAPALDANTFAERRSDPTDK